MHLRSLASAALAAALLAAAPASAAALTPDQAMRVVDSAVLDAYPELRDAASMGVDCQMQSPSRASCGWYATGRVTMSALRCGHEGAGTMRCTVTYRGAATVARQRAGSRARLTAPASSR